MLTDNLNGIIESDLQSNIYDYVFYIRIFEGCNVSCEHCFIPSNPKKMDIEDIRQSFIKIVDILGEQSKDKRILLQFHGGEPSIMGSSFINECIEIYKELPCNVDFGIQTNLTLLNDDLLDIYKNKITKGQFGVSWDIDIRKLKQANECFETIFWDNWKRVLATNIDPVVTMTTTSKFFNHFNSFLKLYAFCFKNNIKNLHLERLTRTGYARGNWNNIGVKNLKYSESMLNIGLDYFRFKSMKDIDLSISPFDGLLKSVSSVIEGDKVFSYGCWSGGCDTGFHTFDSDGYKSSCTALNSEENNKSSIVNIVSKDTMKNLVLRREKCGNCEFSKICSSGCGALDFYDDSKECSGGFKLFQGIKKFIISLQE